VGDREILETYLNAASKNTSETDIFPHGTKSLLTSVINKKKQCNKFVFNIKYVGMFMIYFRIRFHMPSSII